eukprot:gene10967-11122_t
MSEMTPTEAVSTTTGQTPDVEVTHGQYQSSVMSPDGTLTTVTGINPSSDAKTYTGYDPNTNTHVTTTVDPTSGTYTTTMTSSRTSNT